MATSHVTLSLSPKVFEPGDTFFTRQANLDLSGHDLPAVRLQSFFHSSTMLFITTVSIPFLVALLSSSAIAVSTSDASSQKDSSTQGQDPVHQPTSCFGGLCPPKSDGHFPAWDVSSIRLHGLKPSDPTSEPPGYPEWDVLPDGRYGHTVPVKAYTEYLLRHAEWELAICLKMSGRRRLASLRARLPTDVRLGQEKDAMTRSLTRFEKDLHVLERTIGELRDISVEDLAGKPFEPVNRSSLKIQIRRLRTWQRWSEEERQKFMVEQLSHRPPSWTHKSRPADWMDKYIKEWYRFSRRTPNFHRIEAKYRKPQ